MRGNVSCFQPASADVNVTCPIYTGFNGTSCAPLCPLPPYSEERYFRRYDIASWVLVPLSILGELFLLIPWTVQGIKSRNLHTKYPYWLCVSFLCVSISIAMTWGGSREWLCKDAFNVRTQKNDGIIIFQSLLFVGMVVTSNAWICCLIGSLYFKIIFREKGFFGKAGTIFNQPEWVVYHVVCAL